MAIATLGTALADQRPWDGPGSWWVVFPILWFLVFATVVTVAVVLASRRGRLSGRRAGERRLAERYAAGDIDEQEYEQRLGTVRRMSQR
jgi:putative membrane protein